VIALPAGRREPEIDDEFPRKREEHQHRDGVGEEAGGGDNGDIQHRSTGQGNNDRYYGSQQLPEVRDRELPLQADLQDLSFGDLNFCFVPHFNRPV